ncbi:class I SAM-dependent methyltransferase [Cellulomonas shaoxiangyii]|uniref:Class I SAM-dependent methyltransferase n=1 Tax=Cellulomonas shaoxiangyii TaxID=2566013 RepID=A0A4P7SGJ9_9CELL|nr:class I SAM-dependent methyltransferase [Cellulomonas shaoxiangyii]QCB92758.1 class I SAM-dependent methyltransferase [Cellulomonas shaoxiangyii]TGY81524.1 class I SAM-dependent methyltransferase [Cellulomonas shaoxiangyii]
MTSTPGHPVDRPAHEHRGHRLDAHHDARGVHPSPADEATNAALLDLDAEVLGAWLTTATDLVAGHCPDARTVVDLGAGTGTGTLALARRLPAATVVAVDRSAAMLARVRTAARSAGLGDRVRTLEADLDSAWPATGTVDVVWAASSLHHLAQADRVLRDAYAALRPGGVALVAELDEPAQVLPDDLPSAPGLASRLAAAMSPWNAHPDWRPHLEHAGFTVDAVHHVTAEAADGRFVRAWLGHVRAALADRLAPADVAALDRLLARHPAALDALTARTRRTVWVARRADGARPSTHEDPDPARHGAAGVPMHDGGAR